jgi:putative exosortase-associated protein (TIGR04073 family)
MKILMGFLLTVALAANAIADIQDPPMNDFGPTRKLGRALSNISPDILTEIPVTVCQIQDREGDLAAASYGVVTGVGRVFYRFGAGVYELVTFPFPVYKGSYRPPYRSNIPWIHSGYQEFAPELGFESRYDYSRVGSAFP